MGLRGEEGAELGTHHLAAQGRVERELPQLFEGTNIKAHVFRPAYFFPSYEYPQDRLNQRSAVERIADKIQAPVFSTLLSSYYTPINDLARFAIELAKGRWPNQVMYRNAEMRKLVKELPTVSAQNAREEL